ncbi:hypothetical protein HFN76_36450 [Rhizobium laguerreae]|uniref:hypothetical protein n=1 Tax=Rhizobium laguerreae TaxID=1076926 RepID=UPI001C91E8C3|nr:hypothetical protein [Rhizobium laguerreae]MBY3517491.1 hypothetical protein [Rhizobium laguerreae]
MQRRSGSCQLWLVKHWLSKQRGGHTKQEIYEPRPWRRRQNSCDAGYYANINLRNGKSDMKSSSKKTVTSAVPNSSLKSRSVWGHAILAATAMALVSTTQASAAGFRAEQSSIESSSNDDKSNISEREYYKWCESEVTNRTFYYECDGGVSAGQQYLP